MSEHLFVAVWDVDPDARLYTLVDRAGEEFAAMASQALVEVLGAPTFSLDLGRLVGRAPARPLPGRPKQPVPWDNYEPDIAGWDGMAA